MQDLFVETVDPSEPREVPDPRRPKPFETRDETIRVKDAPDIKLVVRSTRHGPVMSDASANLAGLAAPGTALLSRLRA